MPVADPSTSPSACRFALDPHQVAVLAATARAFSVRVEVTDDAGRVLFAHPHEFDSVGEVEAHGFGQGFLRLQPCVRPGTRSLPGRLLARLARELARMLQRDRDTSRQLEQLQGAHARLVETCTRARRVAWEVPEESRGPALVSPSLHRSVAEALGTGRVMISLAGEDLTFIEPGENAQALTAPGEPAVWLELLQHIHAHCFTDDPTWSRLVADEAHAQIVPLDPPHAAGNGSCLAADPGASAPAAAIGGLCADVWPIVVDGRVAGFVAWLRPVAPGAMPAPPDAAQRRLLQGLSWHASHGISSLQLRSEMYGFLFMALQSLAAAVDAKDRYTRGHSERVHYLAMRAGEELGLSAEALRNLSWAALLHDIGKIGIPRSILRKTTALTSEEWEAIHRHPERGCRVVEPIAQLQGTLPAIRHHHERYDGSGYPDGLAGSRIPLLARILAVADAFDAITSERPYSARRTCEEAIEILQQAAGWQFDPQAVAVIARIVRQEVSQKTLSFEAQRAQES